MHVQLEAGVDVGHFVGVYQLGYEGFKLFQAGDVETERNSTGKLVEADALWIFGEESAEGLLLLHVMRVQDDG
jgi:hypothetical protein